MNAYDRKKIEMMKAKKMATKITLADVKDMAKAVDSSIKK